MNEPRRLLLVNPAITTPRHARFPLSLLALAGSLPEGWAPTILDGNLERDCAAAMARLAADAPFDAVGVSVMGGPQVQSAIAVSQAVRAIMPGVPIIWGGYFPSLYPGAASNASYVDYLVRGPGEQALAELLGTVRPRPHPGPHLEPPHPRLAAIAGLSWKHGGATVHNAPRPAGPRRATPVGAYALLGEPRKYFVASFLGRRTVAHQAAIGCRFRCSFCGVAAMFRGATALPPVDALERELLFLKHGLGADSIQFVDHNFFDREQDMVPILELMAKIALPWWCYARSDALLNLSARTWALVRASKLRMAYIGAETASDSLLREVRKGTRVDQTLAVADLCRRHGVIPELSFMVAPPEDPVGETERTFEFIRKVKRVNPASEIIVYIYTPLPPESVPGSARRGWRPLHDAQGRPVEFPSTPEQWTERRWVDYARHADAPWLTDRLRKRIRDFTMVMRCRFPTVQDLDSPRWATSTLRAAASWRYRYRRYDRPWELSLGQRLLQPADPRATGI